jgi:hypothetical protein
MSADDDFRERRSVLAGMLWDSLESMNLERGVNYCDFIRDRPLNDTGRFYTDTCYGEALLVRQGYAGARQTIKGRDIDPDRCIEILIGHTEDWIPFVSILSSQRDRPIEIVGGTDAALREEVRVAHNEIFDGWPLSKDEIDEMIRRQLADESQ